MELADRLRILAPTRYQWRFNGPRTSRHLIENRPFVPLNKIDARYEGVTVFTPWPPRRFDLVHAYNRLPVGSTPYIIGFESHLPRAFWYENTAYYRALVRSLASDRCRGIIAISGHAERIFLETHANDSEFLALKAKLRRRLPNLRLPDAEDALTGDPLDEIRLVFVGSHFARKGGCVAVRVAQIAAERKVPVHVEIVSNLVYGGAVWSDPINRQFFAPYIEGLKGSNITWRHALPNQEALALMRQAHFSILTTFSDTFGYSAIESMANYTPVIATAQGALPEFIEDGVSGVLLDLQTNSRGEWIHLPCDSRDSIEFERLFAQEIERLAEFTLERAVKLISAPQSYRKMRAEARLRANTLFNQVDAQVYWDDLYASSVHRN